MDLLGKLGIDWRLIIWQFVNFTVLLLILWRFAYKPILAALKKRSDTVERSWVQAKEIEERLAKAKSEYDRVLREGEARATAILGEATAGAKKIAEETLAESRAQAARTLEAGKALLDEERARMIADAGKELGSLITLAVEKILEDAAPKVDTKTLVEKAMKTLKI